MVRINRVISAVKYLLVLGLAGGIFAQQPAEQRGPGQAQPAPEAAQGRLAGKRAPLFFREEWKKTHKEEALLTQENVSNPNLELKFYGSADGGMLLNGNGTEDNPAFIFMGTCATPCAATLRDKNNYVDLSGRARIRWVTRVTGFHKVRPMVKLADGTFLVGDHADGEIQTDFDETEFALSTVHWIKVDVDKDSAFSRGQGSEKQVPAGRFGLLTKGEFLENVDLTKVDEVGFVDLMPGSGHGRGGFSEITRFEVYGNPVPRNAAESRANSGS